MFGKTAIAAAAATIITSAAMAAGHGDGKGMGKNMMDKGMMKEDCAAMMKKMEGMKGEKYAMMRKQAMMKMKAGDEAGCMEALKGGMMDGKMKKDGKMMEKMEKMEKKM